MSLQFCTRNGYLFLHGQFIAVGYSGHGEGMNNPELQRVRAVGPIPAGVWAILGPPHDTDAHGPYVLELMPKEGTETFGRSGFLVHGDSKLHPGQASEGCIVLPLGARQAVWESGERLLEVVTVPPDDADRTPPLGKPNPFTTPKE